MAQEEPYSFICEKIFNCHRSLEYENGMIIAQTNGHITEERKVDYNVSVGRRWISRDIGICSSGDTVVRVLFVVKYPQIQLKSESNLCWHSQIWIFTTKFYARINKSLNKFYIKFKALSTPIQRVFIQLFVPSLWS